MIEAGITQQLGGTVRMDWSKSGLKCEIIPAKHLTEVPCNDARPRAGHARQLPALLGWALCLARLNASKYTFTLAYNKQAHTSYHVDSMRDPVATKTRILDAARREFAEHSYTGARIERVARGSKTNVRMIYHYFGGKEKLYVAVLEDMYRRIRDLEKGLDLTHLPPDQGMRRLIQFTFDFLSNNFDIVRLLMGENLQRGRHLRDSRVVPATTIPLRQALDQMLSLGKKDGVFHAKIDPVQLYVSILGLCFIHLSNRYTLSIMFKRDLSNSGWISRRRTHVTDAIMAYLTNLEAEAPSAKGGRR